MIYVVGVVAFFVGFGLAWLVHTILAAREFDRLLWQEEQKKQELINQFNKILEGKEGK